MSFSGQDSLCRGLKLLIYAVAIFPQLWNGDDMTYLTGFVRLGVDAVEKLYSQAGESIHSEAALPDSSPDCRFLAVWPQACHLRKVSTSPSCEE